MAKEKRILKSGDRVKTGDRDLKGGERVKEVERVLKTGENTGWWERTVNILPSSNEPKFVFRSEPGSFSSNMPGYSGRLGNPAVDVAPSLLIAPIPQNILNYAIEVIGSYDAAMKWLTTPSVALGSNPPIYFMLTEKGSEQVHNELLRIEAGVL